MKILLWPFWIARQHTLTYTMSFPGVCKYPNFSHDPNIVDISSPTDTCLSDVMFKIPNSWDIYQLPLCKHTSERRWQAEQKTPHIKTIGQETTDQTFPAKKPAFFYSQIFDRRVSRFERGITSWIKSTARSAPPESRISSDNAWAFQRKALRLVPRSSSSAGPRWHGMEGKT